MTLRTGFHFQRAVRKSPRVAKAENPVRVAIAGRQPVNPFALLQSLRKAKLGQPQLNILFRPRVGPGCRQLIIFFDRAGIIAAL